MNSKIIKLFARNVTMVLLNPNKFVYPVQIIAHCVHKIKKNVWLALIQLIQLIFSVRDKKSVMRRIVKFVVKINVINALMATV